MMVCLGNGEPLVLGLVVGIVCVGGWGFWETEGQGAESQVQNIPQTEL